jgi:hypothetical protein
MGSGRLGSECDQILPMPGGIEQSGKGTSFTRPATNQSQIGSEPLSFAFRAWTQKLSSKEKHYAENFGFGWRSRFSALDTSALKRVTRNKLYRSAEEPAPPKLYVPAAPSQNLRTRTLPKGLDFHICKIAGLEHSKNNDLGHFPLLCHLRRGKPTRYNYGNFPKGLFSVADPSMVCFWA